MPSSNPIEINQFIDSKIIELNKFRTVWLQKNQQNPDLYPLRLPLGDWEEQFFIEIGEEERENK